MKGIRIGRAAMATVASLAVGLGVTACSRDYTVAFTYAVSAQSGKVSAFNVDYQSGSLTQIAGSPFDTNLSNPVTLLTSPDSKNLYVIGGSQDNKVIQMAIGTDGKLYGKNTYNITGSYPTAAAITPDGKFLYVTFTFQNGYTPVSKGPGGVTIFPINTDGSLGTASTLNVGNNPVSIVASALNHFVYVLDADTNSAGGGQGQILGFAQNTSTGALTPVTGTTITTVAGKTVATGFTAGVTPSAIAEDPTARFVYVTDTSSNQLYGYLVGGSTAPGSLTPMVNGPFNTGQYPVAITIDPRGKFLYTANYGASTVGTYAIDPAAGTPSATAASGNFTVATGPTCVSIEPALGIYLFTSNKLDGSVSGGQLDPHTGSLKSIENTPFQASAQLSCVATAANGEHASSIVNP